MRTRTRIWALIVTGAAVGMALAILGTTDTPSWALLAGIIGANIGSVLWDRRAERGRSRHRMRERDDAIQSMATRPHKSMDGHGAGGDMAARRVPPNTSLCCPSKARPRRLALWIAALRLLATSA